MATITGCGTGALFVTKTSISVADIDTAPASVTVAYDRTEGYVAPRGKDGDVPPVLALIRSDGLIVRPDIRQIYATGTAAERLAGDMTGNNSSCTDCETTEDKAPVTFMTSTTIGLKLGFAPESVAPNQFVLGFKRKEASVVPELAQDKKGVYHYPSLLASIKSFTPAGTKENNGICQFFATGNAATSLVTTDKIDLGMADDTMCGPQDAKILKGEYASSRAKQAELTLQASNCYLGLDDSKKQAAWENAAGLGLLASSMDNDPAKALANNQETLKTIQGKVASANQGTDKEKTTAQSLADRIYLGELQNNIGGTIVKGKLAGNDHRAINLQSHRDFVCKK